MDHNQPVKFQNEILLKIKDQHEALRMLWEKNREIQTIISVCRCLIGENISSFNETDLIAMKIMLMKLLEKIQEGIDLGKQTPESSIVANSKLFEDNK
ncbi:hypothetical protein ACH5RR_021337 [Cinchona calisaya]|uniref:Uncharacterized protein n=1 Tax=Cinchona calisaya TaxID=153742 RepID=A0ABD2ZLZ7_9GENT